MVAKSQAGTAPESGKESVLSPVLLIVLAGLWAAVLIPATLRSREHAHDGRTMDGNFDVCGLRNKQEGFNSLKPDRHTISRE